MGPASRLPALLALAATAAAQAEPQPRERAVHLLSRLAFGPTPAEVERVLAMGTDAWLEEQLGEIEDPELEARLAGFGTLSRSAFELQEGVPDFIPASVSREERRRLRTKRELPSRELAAATAARAVYARAQLREVMVDFWRNHFNVSYTKGGPAYQLLTPWDRDVLRANVFAPFGRLLDATAHAPAMLHYLDNASSRRPPTPAELAEIERETRRQTGSRQAGERAADLALQRGLNENYARELLELHTLGVDNGYRQEDVVALAEILTGWSWLRDEDSWHFQFRGDLHVQGSKRFLRQRIQGEPEKGEEEGLEVLALLAEHRGTQQFLATKLVRQFVRDDPPEACVNEVAAALRRTHGDPRAALRALVARPEFWESRGLKFKTPQEFVFSALRVIGAEVEDWSAVVQAVSDMGQPIYKCDDPTGWYDTAEAWLDPGVLALRWRFALDLAEEHVRGVQLGPDVFDGIGDDVPTREWSTHLAQRVLPIKPGVKTQLALDRAVAEAVDRDHQPDVLRRRLLALLLGSPEFQRQ